VDKRVIVAETHRLSRTDKVGLLVLV
jgi:hypothetical protein